MRVFLKASTETYAVIEPNELLTVTISTPDSEYGFVDAIVRLCEKYTSCHEVIGDVTVKRVPAEPGTEYKYCAAGDTRAISVCEIKIIC